MAPLDPGRKVDRGFVGNILGRVKKILMVALLCLEAPGVRALPPVESFQPDMTMYGFADLFAIRPLDMAILPITSGTWALSLPFTAGSKSAQRSYEILVRDPAQHLSARPLGSFSEWNNRDRKKPVLIQLSSGYVLAELTPEQQRRYQVARRQYEERSAIIEKEDVLSEKEREALLQGEARRWDNLIRLLLSL